MEFYSPFSHGFARVATATIATSLADPMGNARAVLEQARAAHDQGVQLLVFPELTLTGYAIDDLVLQDALLEEVHEALALLVRESEGLAPVLVVGAPLRHGSRLLNTAVVLHDGAVLGASPKSYLPTYREFYESRWYASGAGVRDRIEVAGQEVGLDARQVYRAVNVPHLAFHVEICEDMWVPVPPHAQGALDGATVLVNLSASPVTVGRSESRRLLVRSASSRCTAAFLYAASGSGESSTDLAWDGQTMIYENGDLLAENERFADGPTLTVADVDLERLAAERLRQGTFEDNRRHEDVESRVTEFEAAIPAGRQDLRRSVDRFPFVPDDPERLAADCFETYSIQVSALEQRLRAVGEGAKIVIGVSGGLDSTQALLVAARAMDRLGRPRSDILGFTLPGFATSESTKGNALALMKALGTTFEVIDITPAATRMLQDLGHPAGSGEPVYDVTFENVQAGLRTDYLFRIANQRGGIVLGTGDLSELALGWATYGVGDQMSHYGVNAGVPKTLIQHVIRWVASTGTFDEEVSALLGEIVAQEISPELVPGHELQSTESFVGPYPLQDFTLFHLVRAGARPSKIAYLAWCAWHDAAAGDWPAGYPEAKRVAYSLPEVRRWLAVFLERFFRNQFKRSALPNGPKVSNGGTMSPRGDWRMPSDAQVSAWLRELERNVPASDARSNP